jgi:capsular polysaccharide biosynthesis protein
VIENAGVDYTVAELNSMISATSQNDTEIMKVIVICGDPYEAAKIANSIAEVLPIRIAEIIDGASMEVVDSAVPVTTKVGPSISRYTFLGLVLGALITSIIISIFAILDDTIYNEDYVLQNYNYPILAKVPNLLETHRDSNYGYYYKSAKTEPENE